MTDIVDGYVAERAKYFREQYAKAQEALNWLRQASRPDPVTRKVEPVIIEPALYETFTALPQTFFELAYGLDEAVAALNFYASPDTWKEVPDHTFAAQDVGLKARVALARINPV